MAFFLCDLPSVFDSKISLLPLHWPFAPEDFVKMQSISNQGAELIARVASPWMSFFEEDWFDCCCCHRHYHRLPRGRGFSLLATSTLTYKDIGASILLLESVLVANLNASRDKRL